MAIVNRFSFPGAVAAGTDLFVPGVGLFRAGAYDVLASDSSTLSTIRSIVLPLGATETANVDTSLAPVPSGLPDPYPQYMTPAEAAIDPTLRAAYLPKWKPSTAYTAGEPV